MKAFKVLALLGMIAFPLAAQGESLGTLLNEQEIVAIQPVEIDGIRVTHGSSEWPLGVSICKALGFTRLVDAQTKEFDTDETCYEPHVDERTSIVSFSQMTCPAKSPYYHYFTKLTCARNK